jgi:hypothetical protein
MAAFTAPETPLASSAAHRGLASLRAVAWSSGRPGGARPAPESWRVTDRAGGMRGHPRLARRGEYGEHQKAGGRPHRPYGDRTVYFGHVALPRTPRQLCVTTDPGEVTQVTVRTGPRSV